MSWSPDPAGFLADLEAMPAALRQLADTFDAGDPWAPIALAAPRRVILLGMGSSRFAGLAAASRLRSAGLDAVTEYASAEAMHPGGPGTLAIGVSAGGGTAETVEALRRHAAAGSTTVALTNEAGSPLAAEAGHIVLLHAGEEAGGVACRTYQHTLALLLALEAHLAGGGLALLGGAVRRAAGAAEDLLGRRPAWLPPAVDLLTATGRAFVLAPSERLANAEQGALVLREGPRLHADACETGDWLHVDVYLTKPLDYRALLFAGSRFDAPAMRWMAERAATVVAVRCRRSGCGLARSLPRRRQPGRGPVDRGARARPDRRNGLGARVASGPMGTTSAPIGRIDAVVLLEADRAEILAFCTRLSSDDMVRPGLGGGGWSPVDLRASGELGGARAPRTRRLVAQRAGTDRPCPTDRGADSGERRGGPAKGRTKRHLGAPLGGRHPRVAALADRGAHRRGLGGAGDAERPPSARSPSRADPGGHPRPVPPRRGAPS